MLPKRPEMAVELTRLLLSAAESSEILVVPAPATISDMAPHATT
jgi:hypothetical protein